MMPLELLEAGWMAGLALLAVPLERARTVGLWLVVIAFGADELVRWWAWIVVGILQGAMTRESSPGRAW